MPIKTYRPTTQTLRYRTTLVNDDITTKNPHKPLVEPKQRTGGRRNSGDITMRFIGGGHKRKLRLIDFKRDKTGIPATVQTIFKVKVHSVRTATYPGKERRRGRFAGYRPDWKKAYVRLRSGEKMPEYAQNL